MIEKMKEADIALRWNYRKQGFPYFSYRYGEKSRGIIRIGKWEEIHTFFDKEKAKRVTEKKRFNVTPKKILKIIKTFSRGELGYVELHLYLDPLPEAEQENWKTAFNDYDVIYDTED